MIQLKNSTQISAMIEAGRITGEALLVAREHVREGVSTKELDTLIREYIEKCGAKPSFLGYSGFPASACISINDEVIHGIPGKRLLKDGDIVKVDVGACIKGYHGDAARTIFCGNVSEEAIRLEKYTRESFFEGIKFATTANRLGDISHAIQEYVENAGYSVVREFVGHGIGAKLHEDPEVPNFGRAGRGARLYDGMTLAIEPMVNAGAADVSVLDNDWTVVTDDGALSAHYENTILITENGVEILTLL